MGLTFHYHGTFNKNASLPQMIDEAKDIVRTHNWKHHIFEKQFPGTDWDSDKFDGNLYGISSAPAHSEPVWLCFLSNGRISGPHLLQLYGGHQNPKEKDNLYVVSTKTQFARREEHKKVIDLLKYLKGKYFSDLNVYDEGQYWKTGNEALLKKIFSRYETSLDIMDEGLNTNTRNAGESYEAYLKRILKKERFKPNSEE